MVQKGFMVVWEEANLLVLRLEKKSLDLQTWKLYDLQFIEQEQKNCFSGASFSSRSYVGFVPMFIFLSYEILISLVNDISRKFCFVHFCYCR